MWQAGAQRAQASARLKMALLLTAVLALFITEIVLCLLT